MTIAKGSSSARSFQGRFGHKWLCSAKWTISANPTSYSCHFGMLRGFVLPNWSWLTSGATSLEQLRPQFSRSAWALQCLLPSQVALFCEMDHIRQSDLLQLHVGMLRGFATRSSPFCAASARDFHTWKASKAQSTVGPSPLPAFQTAHDDQPPPEPSTLRRMGLTGQVQDPFARLRRRAKRSLN